MRSEEELRSAMDRHADTVRRLCLLHLKNQADTEDIFQTVFLKYALRSAAFTDPGHERAWFIQVTRNACRDLLRSLLRRRTVPLEQAAEIAAAVPEDHWEVWEAVLALPEKYREVVYLHYYEGYSAPEIGRVLGKNPNTVYTLLTRARERLRETLGGEEDAG